MRRITGGLVENDSRAALARQRPGSFDNTRLLAIAYQCGSRITRIKVPCAVLLHDMVVLYHSYCALKVDGVCPGEETARYPNAAVGQQMRYLAKIPTPN
jgi:hypothetical protein